MNDFVKYRKKQTAEMRPYVTGEDMSNISIAMEDSKNGSPRAGDMIARNPNNPKDLWLVSERFVKENYEEIP